jgi:hypothetical protein
MACFAVVARERRWRPNARGGSWQSRAPQLEARALTGGSASLESKTTVWRILRSANDFDEPAFADATIRRAFDRVPIKLAIISFSLAHRNGKAFSHFEIGCTEWRHPRAGPHQSCYVGDRDLHTGRTRLGCRPSGVEASSLTPLSSDRTTDDGNLRKGDRAGGTAAAHEFLDVVHIGRAVHPLTGTRRGSPERRAPGSGRAGSRAAPGGRRTPQAAVHCASIIERRLPHRSQRRARRRTTRHRDLRPSGCRRGRPEEASFTTRCGPLGTRPKRRHSHPEAHPIRDHIRSGGTASSFLP